MAGSGYVLRKPESRVRKAPHLANGSQRALFAFAVLTLFLAATYSGVALLARVTPALFPGRSLRNVAVVAILDKVAPIPEASASGAFTDPIHILVLGIDKRTNQEFLDDGRYLTDVVMVVSIDPITKKTTLLSFPRDMLVEIHRKNGETYEDRINTSYEMGVIDGGNRSAGIDQVKRDMQENFGIKIHNYILVDFEGVAGIVNALGGVTVDVPDELAIYDWPYSDDDRQVRYLSFPEGVNDLDGYEAVAFGRNREGDSDLARIKRQQLIVKAAMEKTFSSGVIGRDPFQLWDAYNSFAKTDIGRGEMPGLADLARRTNGNMTSYSLGDPVDGNQTMTPYVTRLGADVLQWDPENVQYWLSRAFPVTRHADAVVELQNGYADKAQGDSRTAALGHYLVYSKGLVSVYYGENLDPQPTTRVVVHRADQRAAAKDIAEWLEVPPGGLIERLVPAEDTSFPDIAVIVGQDFVIPGTR